MKNQEVEDSQSKEADVSKKNFSQYLLLPTPKGGVCGDYPHVYISQGLFATQLIEAQISLLGYVPPRIGKAKYESEVANCDGRRLEPGKTLLATCEHKWQLYQHMVS